jgi:pantoate--beta-alanine ligase
MVIFKKIQDLQAYLKEQKNSGKTIGFVPTMGALHSGHTSLVSISHAAGDLVVCSIFVNPTQFNDKADFEKYPISVDEDIALLLKANCDVLFLPSVDEMYPNGTSETSDYDLGYLDTVLEAAHRPGHFKGVVQIVAKLLDAVQPDNLYMGQKDYQQCLVIEKMLDIDDRNINMHICPTQREADGLAMSSRNRRLTEPQRALAGVIYQCLVSIQTKKDSGNFEVVQKECIELLKHKGLEPDYVALADADDLTVLDNYDSSRRMVALIAARIGNNRLIDNMLLQ